MLTTRIVDDVQKAEALSDNWRELSKRALHDEPVSTPSWTLAWWRQFGVADGRKLRLVAFEEDGKLVGIAPLSTRVVMHRRAIPIRRIELLASGEDESEEICSDYVGVIVEKGRQADVATLLARVLVKDEALGGWDELVMPAMSGEDELVELLRQALEAEGAKATIAEFGRCPHITLPSTWDDYVKALDSSRRYVVTRSLRELEKWAGKDGYALVRASNDAELAEGRRILHSLHGERWEGQGESGVFASERFTRFHDEMMPKLLAGVDGALDLMWLTVKGEPVAAVYNIVYGGKVYFYQSGRKLDVPKSAKPGIAIHALAIKRSIEAGHREYDFLNGASQYKRQLALATRPLVTLRAVAPSLRARAVDAARTLTERAIVRVRALKKKPAEVAPAASGKPAEDAPG